MSSNDKCFIPELQRKKTLELNYDVLSQSVTNLVQNMRSLNSVSHLDSAIFVRLDSLWYPPVAWLPFAWDLLIYFSANDYRTTGVQTAHVKMYFIMVLLWSWMSTSEIILMSTIHFSLLIVWSSLLQFNCKLWSALNRWHCWKVSHSLCDSIPCIFFIKQHRYDSYIAIFL